ncbi:MAG: GAF domain-containing protein, partial [Acidobacteriota bacterium]
METSEARLQAWLNSLTERFIRAPSTEIDSHVLDGLREIVEYFDVDRSTLFEFDTDGRELTATHSWARDDVETFPASRIGEELPWYQARLAAGEQIVLNRLPDDLPEEAVEERNYCRRSGIRSNLTLPVRVGEFPVCALAVGSFRRAVTWNESTIEKVRLAARILAAGLIRLRQSRELDRARHLARDFFDSLDSMAAILDRQGTIVGVNRAWSDRASGGCGLLDPPTLADPIGKSYLELLHRAAEGGNPWASKAAVRVSSVLKGEVPLSLMEFPSGDEPSGRWTLMRILERESEEGGAIVMNVDISARVEQTLQLERNLEEIERLRQALEEEKLYLKEEIKIDNDFENIVGRSDSLQATLSRIGRVAPTSATVLLL